MQEETGLSRFRDNILRLSGPQVFCVMVSKHQKYYIYLEFQMILGNEGYFFCIFCHFIKLIIMVYGQ